MNKQTEWIRHFIDGVLTELMPIDNQLDGVVKSAEGEADYESGVEGVLDGDERMKIAETIRDCYWQGLKEVAEPRIRKTVGEWIDGAVDDEAERRELREWLEDRLL